MKSFLGESSSVVPNGFGSTEFELELYLNGAKQWFMMTDYENGKLDLIFQLFRSHPIENALIYCNSIANVEYLTTFMIAEGFNVRNLVMI